MTSKTHRSKDDGREGRLENDPRFSRRIEQARHSVRTARAVTPEDLGIE